MYTMDKKIGILTKRNDKWIVHYKNLEIDITDYMEDVLEAKTKQLQHQLKTYQKIVSLVQDEFNGPVAS